MKLIAPLYSIIQDSWRARGHYRGAMFKLFMSLVLVQFSILSLVSVATPPSISALAFGRTCAVDPHFWWGLMSLFGAFSLAAEHCLRFWKIGLATGYTAAIVSFAVLSYDYLTRKPPIYAGSILSITAALFLGGLLYDRLRG